MLNANCQSCKKDFLISEDNQAFCQKMSVPLPTWCPQCRMTRRLSFVNAWSLFWRDCDKCGKKTMSSYRPEYKGKVYCQPCWWADDWDGTEYAMDYDPSRNFLEQWKELQLNTPHCALETTYLTLKNSDYCNGIAYGKNCYLTFWSDYCEDVYYSSLLNELKDSSDCLRMWRSELCYESVGLGRSNRTLFSDTCDDCSEVWFSRNCYGCINCVGCVNMRGASYCIFNQKYSKEEYFEKLKELKLDTRNGIDNMFTEMEKLNKKFPYREYTGNPQNFNVSGDYIFESKNAQDCYMCVNTEDSKFCQFVSVPTAKDCYDYSGWGNGVSQMYECGNVGENANNCKFSFYCFPDSLGLEYSSWCIGGKNNFGCVNLKRQKYAILNKLYDKESYEDLVSRIKQDMNNNPFIDSKGRTYKYGEFFPVEFSLYPYNDANVIKFIPKTKEQALSEGFKWEDKIESKHIPTMQSNSLPQTIKEVDETILMEVIECKSCHKGYKVVSGELNLLKKLDLPIPVKCPKCREERRFDLTNKPFLYETNCDKCGKEIKTAHIKDSGKIVFCEKCYQQEFV